MEDKTELQEFIEICDCEIMDTACVKLEECKTTLSVYRRTFPAVIYLPTIDQLVEMLGDTFYCLFQCEDKQYKYVSKDGKGYYGQSARIALTKAYKEMLK